MMKFFPFFLLIALACAQIRNYCPYHQTVQKIERKNGYDVVHSEIRECPPNAAPLRVADPDSSSLDVLPKFVGSVFPGKVLSWKAKCFAENTATLSFTDTGFVLKVSTTKPASLICNDLYVFGTSDRLALHDFIIRGNHEIKFTLKSPGERQFLEQNGLQVFLFDEKLTKSLIKMYELYMTFLKGTTKDLLDFHKKYFNYTFTPRNNTLIDIPASAIHSGDVLALHVLTPHETYDWILTGSHTGHVAVTIRDPADGQLYVAETTDAKFFPPPYGFHLTKWEEWTKIYFAQGYEVAILHLKPEIARNYNSQAALDWFKAHQMEFICPSFGYTAFDTPHDNVPEPLSMESFLMIATFLSKIEKETIRYNLVEAANMRLLKYHGDQRVGCDEVNCLLGRCVEHNTTLPDLMSLPEIDGWEYQHGLSIVCAGLVMHMHRAGGIYGNIKFNAGEFTPKDVTQMNIFDLEWADRPAACWSSTPGVKYPYCQIMGKYYLDLPEVGTVNPYNWMNDHCGAVPPSYTRFPHGC